MAKQTTKKTAVKPAAKKTVKTVEKKANTPCGCACHEHKHCGCCKGAFWKKLILFIAVFAIGFASAKMTHCKKHKMMPRPEFDNGCLVVKCPKMAKMIPMMDADKDGCVTKQEFMASKKHHRPNKRHHRPEMPTPSVEQK